MQTALKIFDFSSQGNFGPIDKVAVKLSGGPDGTKCQAAADFMEIMGKLMQLDPEQVQASLNQFEKVALEGAEGAGFVPLIDLSEEQADDVDLMGLLTKQTRAQVHTRQGASETDDDNDDCCCRCDDLTGGEKPATDVALDQALRLAARPMDTGMASNPATAPASGKSGLVHQAVDSLPSAPATSPQVDPVSAADANPPQPGTAQTVQPAPGKGLAAAAESSTGEGPKGQPLAPLTADKQVADKQASNDQNSARLNPGFQDPAAEKANRRPVGHQPSSSMSAKPQDPDTTPAPVPLQEPALHGKRALGEKVRVAAEPAAQQAGGVFNNEIEEGSTAMTKGGLDASDSPARATAGRNGFQDMMARVGSRGAQGAESMTADKSANEPSRELQNDVMRQIVQRMTLRTQGSQSRMQIQLKPEFLGNVHMQIATDHQQVAVRMTAESIAVKEMIEQHLSFLKAELQLHGLEIDKFDVQVGNDSEGWKRSQDPSGFRQALKDGQNDRSGRRRGDSSEKDEGVARQEASQGHEKTSEIDYFA